LKAGTDYIIAAPSALLQDQESFADLVEQHMNKELHLYVYSSETDQTREVLFSFFFYDLRLVSFQRTVAILGGPHPLKNLGW